MSSPETSVPKVTLKESASKEAAKAITFFEPLWPTGILLLALISIQVGASFAKNIFSQIAPLGLTTLRVSFAAIMLACVFRVWRIPLKLGAVRPTILYGIFLAAMNTFFYLALVRVPLAITVALSFLGHLCLVLRGTRTCFDLLWVLLAIVGLFLLSPFNALANNIDPLGVLFATSSGICWAFYNCLWKTSRHDTGCERGSFWLCPSW